MSSTQSIALTATTIKLTGEAYCYGHRAWMPVSKFNPAVVGKPRSHCFTCMEKRNKYAKKSPIKE